MHLYRLRELNQPIFRLKHVLINESQLEIGLYANGNG